MASIEVTCPDCRSSHVVKFGKQPNGEQKYYCKNQECSRTTFLLNYHDKGRLPEVQNQIIEMALNGSGIRDTARVLGISTSTVISVLKKKNMKSNKFTH